MRQHPRICTAARPTTRRKLLTGVLFLTTAAGVAQAAEIYKSVDADGKVVYSDHIDPSMSQSTAVQLEDPASLPKELHFCWTNCFTLVLDSGAYHRVDGTSESWTVENFSPNGVVLHRHDAPADWNGYSQDVVYAGQVSNDRLIGVTVNGKPVSGVDASWGASLDTLPGNNAQRDGTANATLGASSGGAVSSTTPPPPLQAEDQPALSQDGLLWTPGYWYWRDLRYVWIPGVWMQPPEIGFLWTPGYWRLAGTVYSFYPGHWGSTVGFYGGVNYGHGYFGTGYSGGHWIGNSFAYNSAVNRVDPAVAHHTFSEPVSGPVSRGTSSYAARSRSADSAHPVSQLPSRAQVATARATTRNDIERTADASATTASNQTTRVKTPAPVTAPRINHTTTQTVPLKQ
jgi:Domain of unknown function (DUF4124)/WXXGXW repeat (2 copies)